jgi:hypothetical protein
VWQISKAAFDQMMVTNNPWPVTIYVVCKFKCIIDRDKMTYKHRHPYCDNNRSLNKKAKSITKNTLMFLRTLNFGFIFFIRKFIMW